MIVSSVGMGLTLYGRKQKRIPHIAVGIALMGFPFLVPGALWIWLIGAALTGALYLATWLGL